MEWEDYEGFLKAYRHIVEGGVKGLYCRYRLKGDEFVNRTRIIPPLVNGFASDPRTSSHDPTRNLVYDNAQAFQIINVNQERDSVPIVMNPVLADLVIDTQEFLLNAGDAGLELRTWVERFIGRKDQFMRFAMRCIYGRNNVLWERCPHPRMVGRWLNILPNFNRISIPYSLKFIGPRTNTRPLNVTTAIAALDVNAANASVLTKLATDPLNERNRVDIENIIKAHLLPGQIQLAVEFDIDDPPVLNVVAALAGKALFSYSARTRNITEETARQADRSIGSFLTSCGYRASLNPDVPLDVRRNRGGVSAFSIMQSNRETGAGWCNTRVAGHVPILDPLYDGVVRMPQLGNVPPHNERADFGTLGNIAQPPIMDDIVAALRELGNENGKVGWPLQKWFSGLIPSYVQYCGMLNQYALSYGETGFRMQDRRMEEMMAGMGAGGLNNSLNSPLIVPVRYDSIYKFYRALPEKFDPPACLAEQLNAESLVSAEMQRVISAFLIMRARAEFDGRNRMFTPRLILQWAISSTESNHFAKKIFELCLSDGDGSRLEMNVLEGTRANFDDFEAIYFDRLAVLVSAHPEVFGFTLSLIKTRRDLPSFSEEAYDALIPGGIITSNSISEADPIPVRRLTWDQMNVYLRGYCLITEMRRRDVLTILPQPIQYDEVIVQELSDGSSPPIKISNVNGANIHLVDSETVSYGKISRRFLKPSDTLVFRPDQIFLGSDCLYYWVRGVV